MSIHALEAHSFTVFCPVLIRIYMRAMHYADGYNNYLQRWCADSRERDFLSFISTDDTLPNGVIYGFHPLPTHWWGSIIRYAPQARNEWSAEIEEIMSDYYELAEFHVDPAAQGRGIGTELLTAFLAQVPTRWVLLSTPEVEGEESAAFHIYRKAGFKDLARNLRFISDPRPFAILYLDREAASPQAMPSS